VGGSEAVEEGCRVLAWAKTSKRYRKKTNEREERIMQVVIREYSGRGAKELFDVLEKNKAEVESVLRSVKGLVSYTLARSGDGGFSVTVCQDQAGIDASVQKARDWVAKNAGHTGVSAPQVSNATVIVHLQ
jgi:hypothetical protein